MNQYSPLVILLIDDSAVDRYIYRQYLQHDKLNNYEILEFQSTKEAIAWCEQHTPNVILLDYSMPDDDGLEFLRQLRETLNNRQSAVIMLTGAGDESIAVSAMKNGAQDYLVKNQFNPKTLHSAIRHAVERINLTQQLEKSREQQQLIAAIALQIRQSLQLEEILQETAKQVRQFLQADRVVVYQFQPDMNGSIVAESVLAPWTVALGKHIQDTCFQQGGGKDYYQGKRRAIDDIYQADLTHCHLQLLEQFEVKANLVVPILVNQQLWGLLIAHQCSASRHWQATELDLLDQLAVQIAIAIQQASAYQQVQTELAQRQRTEAALQASQEKLKLTLNFAGIADWEWNAITNEITVSQNAIHCCYQPNATSCTYQEWLSHIHPEDRQGVEQKFLQAIASQTDYAVEYRVISPDSSIHWVLAKGRGVYHPNGQLLRILGVLMDITERKLSEAERQRAQILQMELQLLEDILETAQIGYWEGNLVENQGYFSPTLKRMLGYETHELTNPATDWQHLMFPEDIPEFLESFVQHFQNDSHTTYFNELRYRHKDGSPVWAICSGRVIKWDNAGKPLRVVGCNINITQRKQAEKALKQSERRYASLAEAAPVAIFQLDAAGQCTYVNERWSEMTGRPIHAALGMGWAEAIHPEDRDRLVDEWSLKFSQRSVDPKEFYESEGRHLRPDGTINWFYVQAIPEINSKGDISGYIGTLTDITERQQAQAALQASEQRYASLAKAAPVAIFRLDANRNCVYANDRWSEMTSRPTQAALGQGWTEAIHPEDYERIRQDWLAAESSPTELINDEGRHIHPDGKITWVQCYVLPETDTSGNIIGYIGTLTDITIRKQTEEQLQHLSERLTLALQSGKFGIWEYDFAQARQIWDDQMYKLYGLSQDNFSCTYQDWLNCLHPDDRDYMLATIDQVLQNNQEYNVEFRIVQPSGNIRFLKGYGILKRDQQGEPIQIIGINYDITERKQAEQELEESRTMLRLVLDTIPQRVFWKDCQSRFLGCNPAFASDNQLTPDQIIGKTDFELPWAKWADFYRQDDVTVMQSRTPKLGYEEPTNNINNIDGEQRWLRTSKIPLTNSAGEVIGVIGSYEDITERKQAEVQLHKTNEQLANTNVELARATRLKDEFLANMSHELRTPLNAILGMSEGFLEGVFGTINERQIKAIATIERSGRHLLELINDILDLSKIESGKLELQLSDVSVSGLCDGSLTFIKQMALKKNIHLTTHIANNIDSIKVDERRLRQVLINLLSNAVKFTPEGGSVKLEVCLEAAEVPGCQGVGEVNSASSLPSLCFHITDTGIGIASEEISKLFQPFVQLDSRLNRQYSGTGLGLALVQRIATMHGGTVSVSSEVGKGSRFSVRIPYNSSDHQPTPQVTTTSPSHCLPAENASVLIIEDSLAAAEQISRYFSEMGMQPNIYSQGAGALEEVLRLQPALIVLDLQLPNLSGWDLLEQFKANPQIQDIPVIIISVVDESTKGLAQGAFEYLVKPITRVQLQATIGKLQASARSSSPNLNVSPTTSSETPLILLVEDNQANIDTISGYLESRGYHLIMANDGQEAIDKTKAQNPDLIVMDIQMSGMDGLEAIRRIRSESQFWHLPIIALTALAMPGDRETCLAAGANEYLTKPVKLKQLVTTIQQLLKR